MQVWEERLQRDERRVKKIAENPDPTKLKSNKLLYEIFRDNSRQLLTAWDAGKPFIYTSLGMRIAKAMGCYYVMSDGEGDRLGNRGLKYLNVVRNLGYPEHGCDRCMAGLGIVLSGDLPPPALTISSNYPCDPVHFMYKILGRTFQCPNFILDIPPEANWETLQYVTAQLEELIAFIEANIPGAKYDEDKLAEYQALWQRGNHAFREVHELRGAVPCPVAGSDTFRMPPSMDIVDDERVPLYAEMYRDELRERVARDFAAVGEEKLRFAWLVSGPYFGDPWTFLARRGVAVPFFEFGFSGFFFGFMEGEFWQERPFGRKLTPLQEEARFALSNIWSGAAERRTEAVIRACRDLKIDALVHYQLWGCPALLGCSQILVERAEKELDIPSLQLEGWELDTEKVNIEEFEAKLGDFVTMCLLRKGIH